MFTNFNGQFATLVTFLNVLALLATCDASGLHSNPNPNLNLKRRHFPNSLPSHKRQHHQNNHDGDGPPDAGESDQPYCPYPRARPRNGLRATASSLITDSAIYDKYKASSAYYREGSYPHLSDSSGRWVWVGADWWTSGFYPATLYLLGERAQMCPGSSDVDWVALGRQWRFVDFFPALNATFC